MQSYNGSIMQSYNGSIKLFSTWMSDMNLPDFSEFILEECVTPGAFAEMKDLDLFETFKDLGVKNKLKFNQLMIQFRKWNLSINSFGNLEYSDEDVMKTFGSMSSKELIRMFNAIGMKNQAEIVKKEKYEGEHFISDELSVEDIFKALEISDDEVYYEIKIIQFAHYLKEIRWLKENREKKEKFKIGSIVYYDHPEEKESIKKKIVKIENVLNVKNSEGEKHCESQYFEFPNYVLVSPEFQSKKKINIEFPVFENGDYRYFEKKLTHLRNIDLFTNSGWREWQRYITAYDFYGTKYQDYKFNALFLKDCGCKTIMSSKFLKEHFGVISGCALWKISSEE